MSCQDTLRSALSLTVLVSLGQGEGFFEQGQSGFRLAFGEELEAKIEQRIGGTPGHARLPQQREGPLVPLAGVLPLTHHKLVECMDVEHLCQQKGIAHLLSQNQGLLIVSPGLTQLAAPFPDQTEIGEDVVDISQRPGWLD